MKYVVNYFDNKSLIKSIESKIDKNKVKFAAEGQLKAILADDDLADEDKEMIEKELKKRQLQKDLRKGGLGVPEQIDDFGGTDRAMRAAAMAHHEQLLQEGFDPTSDEYYSEIDSYI